MMTKTWLILADASAGGVAVVAEVGVGPPAVVLAGRALEDEQAARITMAAMNRDRTRRRMRDTLRGAWDQVLSVRTAGRSSRGCSQPTDAASRLVGLAGARPVLVANR